MNSHTGKRNWRERFPAITNFEHWHQSTKPGKRFEDYYGDGNKDGSTAAKEKGRVEHFGISLEKEEEGNMERGCLTTKTRGGRNCVKEKGLPMDDSPDVGNGGETSGFVTSNMELVSIMNERLNNTIYRLFLGKRVANPVVENCVKNIWWKFVLVKSMIIKDMHFFKFGSHEGMKYMLESVPWTSYARAMIELKDDVDLKDTIVVVVLKFTGVGFTTNIIRVEYEWVPPRCLECKHGKPLEMKVTNKASTSKPNNSTGDQLVESNKDEVELPDDEASKYMSLSGGYGLYEDDLDFYDGYETKVNDLPKLSHPNNDKNTRYDDIIHHTRYKIIPYKDYKDLDSQ
uniref:Zinc knuckle CX2CX4HX4C n=1 Tax=Tanacetum cinerariifolium TaxID=118510 RepID=A0A6L2KRF1_TANCI|nr:zinc knuckle CX2CX4HX4C [Tanacetum cinerariifolium]